MKQNFYFLNDLFAAKQIFSCCYWTVSALLGNRVNLQKCRLLNPASCLWTQNLECNPGILHFFPQRSWCIIMHDLEILGTIILCMIVKATDLAYEFIATLQQSLYAYSVIASRTRIYRMLFISGTSLPYLLLA